MLGGSGVLVCGFCLVWNWMCVLGTMGSRGRTMFISSRAIFGECRCGCVVARGRGGSILGTVGPCVRVSGCNEAIVEGVCCSAGACLLVEESVRGPACGRGLEVHDCKPAATSNGIFMRLGGGCGSIMCGHEMSLPCYRTVS